MGSRHLLFAQIDDVGNVPVPPETTARDVVSQVWSSGRYGHKSAVKRDGFELVTADTQLVAAA